MRLIVSRVVSCIILLLGLVSCSKYNGEQDLRLKLQGIINSGCFISSISKVNNRIDIHLSDGRLLSLNGNNADLFTIGLDGNMHKNGFSSSIAVNEPFKFGSEVVGGDDNEQQLLAITEGFEDWTFHFNQLPSVVIKKTIYSRDFDEVKISINHRGFSIQAPENTIPAFILSRLNGFKYVETDVRFTADGIPVLLHDAEIDRTSNGSGSLSKMSFEQVRRFDFGAWKSSDYVGTRIPSLSEFLALCRDIDLIPVLELKGGRIEQIHQVVDLVKEYGLLNETVFISFSLSLLKEVVEVSPSSRVGYLVSNVNEEALKNACSLRVGTNTVVLDSSDYSKTAVEM